MNLGFKNEQKNKIHNLWKWPEKIYDPGWIGGNNIPISITPWTWQRWTQGFGGYQSYANIRNLTDHSIEVIATAYMGCVFVDLTPGKYVLSFNTDIQTQFRITKFVKISEDKYLFQTDSRYVFGSGLNTVNFEVTDGFYTRLDFGGDNSKWARITDIRILEA